ncbi:MAG TPA: hypothetical protein DCF68_04405 [Cyanothece sp. UBA12306]|nr:hypothetical protein [Cyanothece sp. UBA12306]
MVKTALNEQNIINYLTLAKVINTLPKQNVWTAYDAEADVLYINFYQPPLIADDSELTDDDILIRYQNDEIIGLTILNVSQRC